MAKHPHYIFLGMLLATLFIGLPTTLAVDTDGDGLLDLIDAPNFGPAESGWAKFNNSGIQDLDGVKHLKNVEVLQLIDNQITHIERGDFDGLVVEALVLNGNQITSIESGDFDGLVGREFLQTGFNILQIHLADNRISSIENEAFAGTSHLRSLYLQGNQISSVEHGDFADLNELGFLNLSRNQITDIEDRTFDGLTDLWSLHLSDNRITNIRNETFAGLPSLKLLYLADNEIETIERGAFDDLVNLEEVWLRFDGGSMVTFTSKNLDRLLGCGLEGEVSCRAVIVPEPAGALPVAIALLVAFAAFRGRLTE